MSWLSKSVSITCLMILMEYWVLFSSPSQMIIWNWRVLSENSRPGPVEKIWAIHKRSHVVIVLIDEKRVLGESSVGGWHQDPIHPDVNKTSSYIETFDW